MSFSDLLFGLYFMTVMDLGSWLCLKVCDFLISILEV